MGTRAAVGRFARAPLDALTYRRAVHLLLGGVLLLPYVLIGQAVTSAPVGGRVTDTLAVVSIVALTGAVALPVIAAPAVRGLEVVAARSLLGADLPDPDPVLSRSWSSRLRGAAWYGFNLVVGGLGSGAIAVSLSLALPLLLTPLPGQQRVAALLGVPVRPGHWLNGPATGPVLAAVLLVALVYLLAALGVALARVAPVALGPGAEEALAHERAATRRLAARTRLAQELHDSIGHALTATCLQADAATSVFDTDPEFARRALASIADVGRSAVDDLDRVVTLLREEAEQDGPSADVDGRTGGLGALPELLERTRATGADVRLDVRGDLATVSAVHSRAGFLMVQEAVTNALRHGGAGPLRVRVGVGDDGLALEVTNPCRPSPPGTRPSGGRGLAGLAERGALLGGTFTAGAEPDGLWRARATFPRSSGEMPT